MCGYLGMQNIYADRACGRDKSLDNQQLCRGKWGPRSILEHIQCPCDPRWTEIANKLGLIDENRH
jgi:hypothetical protein